MKPVLITGADGMLASDLINCFSTDPSYEIITLNKRQLDVTSRNEVAAAVTSLKPGYIIHAAALTNVDYCEDHTDEAFLLNGYGTENIAFYAQKVNAKFVYISSCGLFGDEIRPYAEYEPVVLKTVYAKSKYFGEEKTREWSKQYFIIRPGWLFGGAKTHRKNFVYNRLVEAQRNPQLVSANDKFGCPTYTGHLAQEIMSLLETECYGTYHVTNVGSGSRFDYVKKILESLNLKSSLQPVDSSRFERAAPVPDCEILKNFHLSINGFSLLPDWRDAMEEYIHRLKKEL